MAQFYDQLTPELMDFIRVQKVFFVATAAEGARINLSPKGLDGLRVLNERQVAYLDLTGSGNETSAHLHADGRMTLMVCAFEGQAQILRLYGRGRVLARGSDAYARILADAFGGAETPGARQIVLLEIDQAQTSCGYGVPNYAYKGERVTLVRWAEAKGEAGLKAYRAEKNRVSIDGLNTELKD